MTEEQEISAKLKVLKAEREKRETEAADAAKLKALKAELAQELEDAKVDDIVARMTGEHGEENVAWRRVVSRRGHGIVCVKQSHPVTFRKYQDLGKNDTIAWGKLVRPTLVYPSKEEFDSIIEDEPMLLNRCADAVAWLAGARRQTDVGE